MKARTSPAPARPARQQAESLQRCRRDRSLEVAQDYVEAIDDLIRLTGEARAVDLAARLGVTHVTVIRTVARLKRDGYVTAQPYRAIFLTENGRRLADESRVRHETVVAFLRHIGVPERAAEMDAEGMEHHVSPETLAAFRRVMAGSKSSVPTAGAGPASSPPAKV